MHSEILNVGKVPSRSLCGSYDLVSGPWKAGSWNLVISERSEASMNMLQTMNAHRESIEDSHSTKTQPPSKGLLCLCTYFKQLTPSGCLREIKFLLSDIGR